MANRDQWGSRIGFVLAASGSAIGLGNLWKFPYIAWNNHGGSFVLIYLLCIAVVGMPIMMAEIMIGRRTQASPVPAFEAIGSPKWAFVGWLGVISGLVILAFYAVIAGWSISSFVACLKWSFGGYEKPAADAFGNFIGNGKIQVGLSFTFLCLTSIVVARGISRGIEKTTKILMPILLAIMVYLTINAFFLDGFGRTLSFLFAPDFSEVEGQSILEAMGHAFFTLSLGMGAMITYGSYMKKEESILKSSLAIVILDTVIALLACMIMYSIIFSVDGMEDQLAAGNVSTVGMLFVTLPELFYTQMPGGAIVGPVFYILVGFAALTSTISLLEVVVALLVDKFKLQRVRATAIAAGSIFVLTICCALSLGASDFFTSFKVFGSADSGLMNELNQIFTNNKAGFLGIFDHVSANWLLPVGGLFLTIYGGWILPKKISLEELDLQDADGNVHWLYTSWLFIMRFVAPLAILTIIGFVISGEDFS